MGTLEKHLRARRDSGRKLLLPYVSGGVSDDWLDIIRAYDDAGADAIEVGIPFSDPVMDGPTIQAASDRALERGTTPISILSELRDLDVSTPLIVMTYANVPFRFGFDRFVDECGAAGVRGAIIPDVPMEELDPWEEAVGDADLDTVMLASPISSDDRLARLVERSRGFVYGVNVLGVTGERADIGEWSAKLAGRLKAVSDLPVVMGFGISSPETAVVASAASDGVVVASAIMRIILDGGTAVEAGAFVATLRAALDRG
ncbi:tryptophan synthase subunit alpha [Actinospongicola halichondriae]|uniref:tryptophan synthase subunit alpha n=1 Tax=Actinospongicola halichondriae TaxID=3236844 RepID=UPI003D4E249F